MIDCLTYENLHLFGGAFAGQFRLRHDCFVRRLNYQVSSYNRMEYDQYDNPSAVYLVFRSGEDVLGASRLAPTTQSCMLRDLWPEMVDDKKLLNSSATWEGTRFCVSKRADSHLRRRISRELVLAYVELGLRNGISQIIGVMPGLILRSVFRDAGCEYRLLGPMKVIDNERIYAAGMEVSDRQLQRIRRKTGIAHGVLNTKGLKNERRQAA